MTSKLEEAAQAHGKFIYEKEGSSHSECSEYEGFKTGAKWLLEEAKKVAKQRPDGATISKSVAIADLEKLVEEERLKTNQ